MIGSRLVWKMAWQNMKRHWKQTLLTAIAGAIGAMLLSISFVNYESVKHSGQGWIDTHFGLVDWELTPPYNHPQEAFSASEVKSIIEPYVQRKDPLRFLPIVRGETAVIAEVKAQDKAQSKNGLLLLGIPSDQAAKFDARLASVQLREDEALIDDDTARSLELTEGDAIRLTDHTGSQVLYQVRMVPRGSESSLIQFRGNNAMATGTVIINEHAARSLVGLAEGYHTLLVGRTDSSLPVSSFAMFEQDTQHKFEVRLLKDNAIKRIDRLSFGFMIGMVSSVAVISSALLLRQVLIMIAESRRELFGVLRALGLSRGQVRGLFAAEALLLSLFIAVVGTLLGVAGGWMLIKQFYGSHAAPLSQMSGANILIKPYVYPIGLGWLFTAVLLYLVVIALWAARQAGRAPIVETLRGAPTSVATQLRRRRPGFIFWCSLAVVAAHLYQALMTNTTPNDDTIGTIIMLWIGGCLGAVILVLQLINYASTYLGRALRRVGFPAISVQLAIKYLGVNKGRTMTIALLFAFVMMVLTFTGNLTALVVQKNAVDRNNQTMLGFGGYVSYDNVSQKEAALRLAGEDETIRPYIEATATVEPYMLLMAKEQGPQTILPVTKDLLRGDKLKLIERDPKFERDEDVWEAVMNNPDYVVLPISKRGDQLTRASGSAPTPASDGSPRVGERIILPIYEEEPRGLNDAWEAVGEQAFIVAGFADSNSGRDERFQLYETTFVHESVHQALRPYGFKWPNQSGGFVLLQFDYRNTEVTQALQDNFIMNGILNLKIPYVAQTGEQLINRELARGFIGFTALSAVIGLFGLAIVQFRAVQERGKTIAMLRCIGLSTKQMTHMFILEGSIVATVGLLVGWGIGTSGATTSLRLAVEDVKPHEQVAPISYNNELLVPILLVLILVAILINIGPARAALRLSPADALRSQDT